MCLIFRKLTIFFRERKCGKRKEFVREKDNNRQLFVTRKNNILDLLEI